MTTTTTTTDNLDNLANIPHPAGAVRVYEWYNNDQPVGAVVNHVNAETARYFVGTARLIGRPDTDDIRVAIDGTQYADGQVERNILVGELHPDWPLTPALARDLIAVLAAVADEVEQMKRSRPDHS
jgi:hypothetical protein